MGQSFTGLGFQFVVDPELFNILKTARRVE